MTKEPKWRKSHVVVVSAIVAITVGIVLVALRQPPHEGCCREVGPLSRIETLRQGGNCQEIAISDSTHKIWARTCFRRATAQEYPGETPDHLTTLFIGRKRHHALYNDGSALVFFTFVSDFRYSYGWLSAPPPGGWAQPLYVMEATPEILKAFGLQ